MFWDFKKKLWLLPSTKKDKIYQKKKPQGGIGKFETRVIASSCR